MSKKDTEVNGTCPNCGYCPHCGRSYRTQPYWYYYQPWWTQPWYSHTGVWAVPCNGTVTTTGNPQFLTGMSTVSSEVPNA